MMPWRHGGEAEQLAPDRTCSVSNEADVDGGFTEGTFSVAEAHEEESFYNHLSNYPNSESEETHDSTAASKPRVQV